MDPIITLTQLLKYTKAITGRKKIQKMVHLLQECAGAPFGFSFRLSHYGAFSSELAQTLDMLTAQNLLIAEDSLAGSYQTQSYSANEELLDVLEIVSNADEVPEWIGQAKVLNEWSTSKLEAVSTVVFLRKAGWKDESLREQFKACKAHLISLLPEAEVEADRLLSMALHRRV